MVVVHSKPVPASLWQGGLNKGAHNTPSGFRGQCPLRGLCVAVDLPHYQTILIFRAAGRIIWTWRLWNGRPSWRWAWLLFVLRLLSCVIFILVAVRTHYDFSCFFYRQHTIPFHTRNIATLHVQQNFRTANASNSRISAERSRNSSSYLVV